jgi:phage shock protein A
MTEPEQTEAEFNSMTGRLLRREALRRAAAELNTTSGPGLEDVLARVSAEVTADAVERLAEKYPEQKR